METNRDEHDAFSTDWSLVRQVQGGDPKHRQAALAVLLQFYRRAFLAQLICRMRIEPTLAEDLIQGYIADKILERDLLADAAPAKGRLRNLLLRSLQNYAIDHIRRIHRDPRGVGGDSEGHDDLLNLPEQEADQVDPFDVAWGREVLGQALRLMRDECVAKAYPERWQLFECRVLAPLTGRSDAVSYDVLVERFGFQSPQQASNVLATAKRQFHRALESVLREYCDATDVGDELAELFRVLGKSAQPCGAIAEFLDAQAGTCEDATMNYAGQLAEECLAALINPDLDEDGDWSDSDLASMWRQLLGLSTDFLVSQSRFYDSIMSFGNARALPMIASLLHGPHGAQSELRKLKDWAKTQVRRGHDGLPRELAAALYFVSIAVARLHHGQPISKLDDSILRNGLKACEMKPWLDAATRQLITDTLKTLDVK